MEIVEKCAAYERLLDEMFTYLKRMSEIDNGLGNKAINEGTRRYFMGSKDMSSILHMEFYHKFLKIKENKDD